MEEKSFSKEINIKEILRLIWSHKKLYIIVLALAFVLASAYILCIPRYYRAEVRLAPETDNGSGLSSLSSIASSFGFDLGSGQTADAISPELYPDLFESNDFVVSLLDIQIQTSTGEYKEDYYTYMKKHQKRTPWAPVKSWFKKLLSPKPKKNVVKGTGDGRINAFCLSEEDFALVEKVKESIVCKVDKKTDVIIISVQDQDPLVCATMADSVRAHLQQFITDYRTSKARVDVEYYQQLCTEAEEKYEASVIEYGIYADSHQNVILQSFISKRDELENDMQVNFNTLTALRQQLQTSEAKVQERTPAFTVIQSASVPVKPSGPKRMFFVAGVLMFAFLATTLWICRKVLFASLIKESTVTE